MEKKSNFCEICNYEFSRIDKLKRHIEEIHEFDVKKGFKCTYCLTTFKRKEHLIRHEMGRHVGLKFYCTFCKKYFYEKCRLERHMEDLHNVFSCQTCLNPVPKEELESHKKKCYSNPLQSNFSEKPRPDIIFCKLCPCGYQRPGYLVRHVLKVHLNIEEVRQILLGDEIQEEDLKKIAYVNPDWKLLNFPRTAINGDTNKEEAQIYLKMKLEFHQLKDLYLSKDGEILDKIKIKRKRRKSKKIIKKNNIKKKIREKNNIKKKIIKKKIKDKFVIDEMKDDCGNLTDVSNPDDKEIFLSLIDENSTSSGNHCRSKNFKDKKINSGKNLSTKLDKSDNNSYIEIMSSDSFESFDEVRDIKFGVFNLLKMQFLEKKTFNF